MQILTTYLFLLLYFPNCVFFVSSKNVSVLLLEQHYVNIWAERQRSVDTRYCSLNTDLRISYEDLPARHKATTEEMFGTQKCRASLKIHFLKDYKRKRTVCFYKEPATDGIFEQELFMDLEGLSFTVERLYMSVNPVSGFVVGEPNSVIQGYLIDKKFYGTIRMYDKFRLYHIIFYIEPLSNAGLYNKKYVEEEVPHRPAENAILFEYVSHVEESEWIHCDSSMRPKNESAQLNSTAIYGNETSTTTNATVTVRTVTTPHLTTGVNDTYGNTTYGNATPIHSTIVLQHSTEASPYPNVTFGFYNHSTEATSVAYNSTVSHCTEYVPIVHSTDWNPNATDNMTKPVHSTYFSNETTAVSTTTLNPLFSTEVTTPSNVTSEPNITTTTDKWEDNDNEPQKGEVAVVMGPKCERINTKVQDRNATYFVFSLTKPFEDTEALNTIMNRFIIVEMQTGGEFIITVVSATKNKIIGRTVKPSKVTKLRPLRCAQISFQHVHKKETAVEGYVIQNFQQQVLVVDTGNPKINYSTIIAFCVTHRHKGYLIHNVSGPIVTLVRNDICKFTPFNASTERSNETFEYFHSTEKARIGANVGDTVTLEIPGSQPDTATIISEDASGLVVEVKKPLDPDIVGRPVVITSPNGTALVNGTVVSMNGTNIVITYETLDTPIVHSTEFNFFHSTESWGRKNDTEGVVTFNGTGNHSTERMPVPFHSTTVLPLNITATETTSNDFRITGNASHSTESLPVPFHSTQRLDPNRTETTTISTIPTTTIKTTPPDDDLPKKNTTITFRGPDCEWMKGVIEDRNATAFKIKVDTPNPENNLLLGHNIIVGDPAGGEFFVKIKKTTDTHIIAEIIPLDVYKKIKPLVCSFYTCQYPGKPEEVLQGTVVLNFGGKLEVDADVIKVKPGDVLNCKGHNVTVEIVNGTIVVLVPFNSTTFDDGLPEKNSTVPIRGPECDWIKGRIEDRNETFFNIKLDTPDPDNAFLLGHNIIAGHPEGGEFFLKIVQATETNVIGEHIPQPKTVKPVVCSVLSCVLPGGQDKVLQGTVILHFDGKIQLDADLINVKPGDQLDCKGRNVTVETVNGTDVELIYEQPEQEPTIYHSTDPWESTFPMSHSTEPNNDGVIHMPFVPSTEESQMHSTDVIISTPPDVFSTEVYGDNSGATGSGSTGQPPQKDPDNGSGGQPPEKDPDNGSGNMSGNNTLQHSTEMPLYSTEVLPEDALVRDEFVPSTEVGDAAAGNVPEGNASVGTGANGNGTNDNGANDSGANGTGANGSEANGNGANGSGANGNGANGNGENGGGVSGNGAIDAGKPNKPVPVHSTIPPESYHSTIPTNISENHRIPTNISENHRRKRSAFNFNTFFGENTIETELEEDVDGQMDFLGDFTSSNIFDLRVEKSSICQLCIWIQPHFAHTFGLGGGILHGVAEILDIIKFTNWIFRSMDFNQDGIPENIGFTVKSVILTDSVEFVPSSRRKRESPNYNEVINAKHQGLFEDYYEIDEDDYSSNDTQNMTNSVNTDTTNLTELEGILGNFSKITTILTAKAALIQAGGLYSRFDGCCAILGFLYHDLVPAISATTERGLCSSSNLGLISGFLHQHKLTKFDVFRGVMHTLGHLFGAPHDSVSEDCEDNQYYNFINPFVLHPIQQTNIGVRPNSFRYSPCAKDEITMFLSSNNPQCLREEESAFCGNGLMDEGEDCDCGSPWQCHLSSPCCGEKDVFMGCRVIDPMKKSCSKPLIW